MLGHSTTKNKLTVRRLKAGASALGLATLLMAVSAGATPTQFAYDELGRVTGVHYPDGSTVTYSYDAAGNRTQVNRHTTNVDPVAVADAVSAAYNTPLTFNPLSNDTDGNGDTLSVSGVGTAAHGLPSPHGTSITYTPTSGFSGSDTFSYSIADGHGGSASSTVSVTVTVMPPTPGNDSASANSLAGVTFDPLVNDTDPNGLAIAVTGVSGASHGTTDFTGTSVSYTPAAGFIGDDNFSYTITNSGGGSASANVSVSVVNSGPTANDDSITAPYFQYINFDPRPNDTDPNGDTLTITGVSNATHGSTFFNPDASANPISYAGLTGFSGDDSFTYSITDGHGGTAMATVHVTVADGAPRAEPDSASTAYTTGVTIYPLTNDYDPNEGDTFSLTGIGTAAHGSTSASGSTVTYTPSSGFSGTDSFNYTITDNHGTTGTGTITVSVANGAPIATSDSVSTPYDTPVSIDPRLNDNDPDGGSLTVSGIAIMAIYGTASYNGTSVTYKPPTHFSGEDHFSYAVSDGQGGTSTAVVTVTVENGSPTAVDDSLTTGFNSSGVPFDPRVNDNDPNGDNLTVTDAGHVQYGSVTYNATSVTYTPPTGFSGEDHFTYTISDGNGGTSTANIDVTVQPIPVTTIYVYNSSNLRDLANAGGYNGASGGTFEFIVPSGTEIDGAQGGEALVTGTWPSGVTLHLIVNGNVYGGGGKGGDGSCSGTSLDGGNGEPGLYVQAPINVTVNGSLLGGGGGGAGAAQYYDGGFNCGGGGGGGGPNGNGGAPDGGGGSGGSGGSAGPGDSNDGATYGGDGGSPGNSGGNATGWAGGGNPGSPGQSIQTNGFTVNVDGSGAH